MYHLARRRRHITCRNIALCFPERDAEAQQMLVRKTFRSAGISLMETGLAWWGKDKMLAKRVEIEGLEHLQQASAPGKGVLLLGAHFTSLEISGRLLSQFHPCAAMYRKHDNPLFEAIIKHSRETHLDKIISRRDMRGMVRALREGTVVWYATDQDFGPRNCVFAPFFGIQTASLVMTSKLARLSGAPVVPFFSQRLDDNSGYKLILLPALTDFPGSDDVADATRINAIIEKQVRKVPDQYLWLHRRFKTRPEGKASPACIAGRIKNGPGIVTASAAKKHRHEQQTAMSKGLLRYRLLLRLLSPLILVFNAWQTIRARELRLFRQRLGTGLPQRTDAPLWLHAASVGELIAAQSLIMALRERFPHIPVVITTVTPTGAALVQQRLPTDVQHIYLPMDWPGATRRFLRTINPRAALIMETELWPNLFENIARQNIPLIIVNGRLSSRSRDAATWIKKLYAITLKKVSVILARSADDASAYIQLGTPADKVRPVGNIKWASTNNIAEIQTIDPGRPYVLAASTHDDEEQQLAHIWKKMAQQTRDRLLVIAPRHPQRRDDILRQLEKQFAGQAIAVRSRGDTINADTRIYLADTLGELEGFMAGADCVFMGGSLVPRGGHNILEPARLGKPVVFGAHMTNFLEEAQLLLQAGGAKQVVDKQALHETLSDWLAHPQTASAFGKKAAQILSQQNSVLEDYLQAITETCELKPER